MSLVPFTAPQHTWLTPTLVTPHSRIVLRRPSFAEPPPLQPSSRPPAPSEETPLPAPAAKQSASAPLAYAPFAQCSNNLVTCASNSGKTQFLTKVIQHRHIFFQDARCIRRVVYVNGASLDHPWTESSLGVPVVSISLDDFKDPATFFSPFDVVVIDDLIQVTPEIQFLLTYGTHHYKLYLFLVTQSCLSSSLYGLLRLAHNLILIFGNSATSRLAQHLAQSFFLCSDTKTYLKGFLSIAERQQDIVLLKLNAVASYRPHLHVLALSRVQGLFDKSWPHCFVYPELGRAEHLWKTMEASESHESVHLPPLEGDYLEQAFVLVPVDKIRPLTFGGGDVSSSSSHPEAEEEEDCVKQKRQHWNEMTQYLDNEIKQAFRTDRWPAARNLCREMLRCSHLCIEPNFKTVYIRGKPKWRFVIIDFLQVATRRAGPGERWSEKVAHFKPLVELLLQHNMPESYIANKLLLDPSETSVWRAPRPSSRPRNQPPPPPRARRYSRSAERHHKDMDPFYDY